MIDVTRQIEAYAEQLDHTVPPAAELFAGRGQVQPSLPSRPRWWAAAAVLGTATVVLIAVGLVALNGGNEGVAGNSTSPGPATTTTAKAVPTILRFELATEAPAFGTGESGAWDWPFVSPGAVILQDGVYHMLRNGFGEERATGIGHGTSDDGVRWGAVGADPVAIFEGGQVHTGLVTADGTWVLYFDAETAEGNDSQYRSIGRASAPGPEGPWAFDTAPVLVPGGPGAWDQSSVSQPAVLETGDGYVMFYVGTGGAGSAVGRAISPDGISWTKAEQPVLVPEAEWEGRTLTRPDAVTTEDGLVMMYGNQSGSNRGVATSPDGVVWTRFPGNPVLTTAAVPRATMKTGELFYRDGVYLLYLETGGRLSGTNIAVLTRDEPIVIR